MELSLGQVFFILAIAVALIPILGIVLKRGKAKSIRANGGYDISLPQGAIYESGAGLQCCCPTCEYGVGDNEIFIEGFSRVFEKTCSKCGTNYLGISISSVPISGKFDW